MKSYVMITMFILLYIILIETVINLQDEEGFTPLMWAAAHGQIAVVEFLLQNVRTVELRCIIQIREHALFIYSLVVFLDHSSL